MGTQNINQTSITGNLTRDPELRTLPSGTQVASLRVAVNGRRKNQQTGQWEDKPNYFNVSVFGGAGESAARYLKKGRGVAIAGRLDWREWTDNDQKRHESVEIVAETIQFLSDGPSAAAESAPATSNHPAGARTDGGYGQVSTDDQGDEIPF